MQLWRLLSRALGALQEDAAAPEEKGRGRLTRHSGENEMPRVRIMASHGPTRTGRAMADLAAESASQGCRAALGGPAGFMSPASFPPGRSFKATPETASLPSLSHQASRSAAIRIRFDLPGDGPGAIVFGPVPQGSVELQQGLVGIAGEDRAAASIDHEIPHGRVGRLGAPVVGRSALVRGEVKAATLNRQVVLLGLESGHGVCRGSAVRREASPEMGGTHSASRGGGEEAPPRSGT
jgi:hypothetical protein